MRPQTLPHARQGRFFRSANQLSNWNKRRQIPCAATPAPPYSVRPSSCGHPFYTVVQRCFFSRAGHPASPSRSARPAVRGAACFYAVSAPLFAAQPTKIFCRAFSKSGEYRRVQHPRQPRCACHGFCWRKALRLNRLLRPAARSLRGLRPGTKGAAPSPAASPKGGRKLLIDAA